jgi:hypothetical protein
MRIIGDLPVLKCRPWLICSTERAYPGVATRPVKDPCGTAPTAINHICGPVKGVCRGPDWKNVVANPPQLLTDIAHGTLAQVSWVVPAGSYSDHPTSGSGGPAWVASIVDAVGQSPYWTDTAILVTWDDWGGWYDHVSPLTKLDGLVRFVLLRISCSTAGDFGSDTADGGQPDSRFRKHRSLRGVELWAA